MSFGAQTQTPSGPHRFTTGSNWPLPYNPSLNDKPTCHNLLAATNVNHKQTQFQQTTLSVKEDPRTFNGTQIAKAVPDHGYVWNVLYRCIRHTFLNDRKHQPQKWYLFVSNPESYPWARVSMEYVRF